MTQENCKIKKLVLVKTPSRFIVYSYVIEFADSESDLGLCN